MTSIDQSSRPDTVTSPDRTQRTGRILILSPNSPQVLGGMEHFVRGLGEGLEALGYAVEYFHRENSLPAWMNQKPFARMRKFSASALGYFIGRRAQAKLGDDVVAVISNSDVGYYPLHPSSKRTRLIHFYHGTYRGQAEAIRPFITYPGYLYLKWWNSMVLERLSGRNHQVLCCSDPVGEEVLRFFGLASNTVWLPMDLSRFFPRDPQTCRRELGLPDSGPIGVFVGSAHATKGFPVVRKLIEAFPDVRWGLAFRGTVPEDIGTNPHVRIFHEMANEKIPLLYGAADFALSPSRYDAFPYAVCEALACGTPVIASPSGASRLFLKEPPLNRFLVSHADAMPEFLEAVRELLRDPCFYRKAVLTNIRPMIEEVMLPENWWRRFLAVTGL
jgi:glycosyltransferase involved in cell wall biosynthesis